MVDNKPVTIQRQLSRLDSAEDYNNTTYTLQCQGSPQTPTGKTTKWCTVILTILSAVSVFSVFFLWALANTVYKPTQLPQGLLVDTLQPNDTVLLQTFNPFYIESIVLSYTSSDSEYNFLIRKLPCTQLSTESREINETHEILNITKQANEITTFYLVKGSVVTMTIGFEHTHFHTNDSILASLYVYNEKKKFAYFLKNGPKHKKSPSHVFKVGNETDKFVLNVSQTNYYFIGLFIPKDVKPDIQEVDYIIQGNVSRFNEKWVEPTCTLTPPTNSSCEMNFTNPHMNSEKNNVCILGMNTGEEFSSLELKVKGNGYVNRISFILVELSFAVCGSVVITNMLILLCVFLMQE